MAGVMQSQKQKLQIDMYIIRTPLFGLFGGNR